jgi:hypothetical protein
MPEHQQHARVAHRHGQGLQAADAALVEQPAEHQHERGVEVQDQPFQAGADELQPPEIEKTREVITGEPQAQNAQPVFAGERRLAAAPLPVRGPPGQRQEQRQRKQHAVHDQRDRVHAMAVGELDDDGLATEGDGARAGEQQAGGEVGMGSGGGNGHRSDYRQMPAHPLSPVTQALRAGRVQALGDEAR